MLLGMRSPPLICQVISESSRKKMLGLTQPRVDQDELGKENKNTRPISTSHFSTPPCPSQTKERLNSYFW